jgi:CheY-like chemotaxis protein
MDEAAWSDRAMSKVLVVEDSTSAREVVMRILRREGYDVVGASNGLEGLDAVEHEDPDLVLLDVMMPEMDGFTMLERLRRDTTHRDLPVVMLSALSDEQRLARAQELGAKGYLVKSRFTYDDLIEQVARNVRHS